MVYIVLDLEWNGAYSRKAHGYFNEIIDIGAVKLDEDLKEIDRFQVMIKPVITRKLSSIVQNLTHIEQDELDDGTTFHKAIYAFRDWIGEGDAALLTWSTTDLLVLIENFRFFIHRQSIPFMTHYADIQRYCQKIMQVDLAHQLGLRDACARLSVLAEGMEIHRALGDSILTAQVLQKVGDPATLRDSLSVADTAFYDRLLFKPVILRDIQSPLIKRSELRFSCPVCGHNLRRKSDFAFRNRAFCADFICNRCQQLYNGRVQFKQTYDGIVIKRKLVEKKSPQENIQQKGESNEKGQCNE